MNTNFIAGISVGIVHGNETVYLKSYGKSDFGGTPMTPQTNFLIGEISETFTATAIMKLVEDGYINLDSPVQSYIPSFTLRNAEEASKITVRHCLHHLSGLSEKAGIRIEKHDTLQEIVSNLANEKLQSVPGEQLEISSANYYILGLIIETVSGTPYSDFISNSICGPLGMNNTHFSRTTLDEAELSSGFNIWYGLMTETSKNYSPVLAPSKTIMSNAEDLTRLLKVHMNQGNYAQNFSLLSRNTTYQMHQLPINFQDKTDYAMGFYNISINGTNFIWNVGSLDDFYAEMLFSPENDYGVVVLMNTNSLIGEYGYLRNIGISVLGFLTNSSVYSLKVNYIFIYFLVDLLILFSLVRDGVGIVKLRPKMDLKLAEIVSPKGQKQFVGSHIIVNVIMVPFLIIVVPTILVYGLGFGGAVLGDFITKQTDLFVWLLVTAAMQLVRGGRTAFLYRNLLFEL